MCEQSPASEEVKEDASSTCPVSSLQIETESSKSKPVKTVRERRRKNRMPDIDEKLNTLLEFFKVTDISCLKAKHTGMKKRSMNQGGRSSKYIGVSKNGDNWQALINYQHTKKYIGTYSSDLEAAVAYDFYSIAIKGLKNNINFSYDIETVIDMINSYQSGDRCFRPCLFIDRIK